MSIQSRIRHWLWRWLQLDTLDARLGHRISRVNRDLIDAKIETWDTEKEFKIKLRDLEKRIDQLDRNHSYILRKVT